MSNITKERMRNSTIKHLEKTKFDGKIMIPSISKNETIILNELEKTLNYKILRQYKVVGYFLDGYIPEINMAIEIDEKKHEKQWKKDYIRELNIRNKLSTHNQKCIFIRIKEEVALNAIQT